MNNISSSYQGIRRGTFLFIIMILLVETSLAHDPERAEPEASAANRASQAQSDRQDCEDATRGFIATSPDPSHPGEYAFLSGEAPSAVNPSLWRQAQLNAISGLFRVADGVYQVRGFSVSTMTIVEGRTGIVIVDTLPTPGAASEALKLYFAHRPIKREPLRL